MKQTLIKFEDMIITSPDFNNLITNPVIITSVAGDSHVCARVTAPSQFTHSELRLKSEFIVALQESCELTQRAECP